MPELPDLRILAEALSSAVADRRLLAIDVQEPLVMRGTRSDVEALSGQALRGVTQRGKFLVLDLAAGRVILNAMLTGRVGLAARGDKPLRQTAAVLTFSPRGAAPGPGRTAAWTRGAAWLPPEDEPLELRYRDPKRMGKLYLLPAGVEREVAGWADLGPDADDPGLDLPTWSERIGRHGGELMNLLKNQRFVAGIGNGYSDEILWAARLAPFRRRQSLADEEVERLWRATREVMAWAIGELRSRVPPRFEVEVRDFLRVHGKGGQACPRCGSTLSQVSPGGFVTTWCRACQA